MKPLAMTSVVVLLCSVSVARIWGGEPASSPSETAPAQAALSTEPASAAGAPAAVSKAAGGETWRYRHHQGLWWYWLPSEKWVIWSDGKWVPYDPASFATLHAAPRGRTTYYRGSNSGYPDLGKWGPVRYNGYGQREYPYSRRNSGIRQLGPVPAMGGVRAMPGWGGER